MSAADDLVPLLTGSADSGDLGYRSGLVTEWDPGTGQNTIVVLGVEIHDIPSLATTEVLTTSVGDTVGLLKVKSQYFILGRISTAMPANIQGQIDQLQQSLNLLLAGDVKVGGVLTVAGALNASGPVRYTSPFMVTRLAEDGTDIENIASTSFVAGSPVCGFTFRIPPSGVIDVTVSGYIAQRLGGNSTALSYQINTGDVIGSGSAIISGSFNRSVRIGKVVNTGEPVEVNASYNRPHSGFTPFATVNIFTVHAVSGGSHGDVFQRGISVKPLTA